jgi:hypothetical protein
VRWCLRCQERVPIAGKSCAVCRGRILSRLPDELVARLHYAYTKGATLAELARHPITRGIGLGRGEQMRTLRITREFRARGLHVRESSEAQRVKRARERREAVIPHAI